MIRDNVEKDIFFAYSKSAPLAFRLVTAAKKLLAATGFESWEYEDWQWQSLDYREYGRSGSGIDVPRLAAGHPRPLYKSKPGSVDTNSLERMMRLSRVVACVSPVPAEATGVLAEIDLIDRQERAYGSRPFSLIRFEPTIHQELAFDQLDFDESIHFPLPRGASSAAIARLATVLGLVALRHVLTGQPRGGEERRWADRVADAKAKIRNLLQDTGANTHVLHASAETSGDKLEALIIAEQRKLEAIL